MLQSSGLQGAGHDLPNNNNNRCLRLQGTQTLGHTLAHRRFTGKALGLNDGQGVKVADSGRGRSEL